jgi:hypothetical protein
VWNGKRGTFTAKATQNDRNNSRPTPFEMLPFAEVYAVRVRTSNVSGWPARW